MFFFISLCFFCHLTVIHLFFTQFHLHSLFSHFSLKRFFLTIIHTHRNMDVQQWKQIIIEWFSWQSTYVTTIFQGLYFHRSLGEGLQKNYLYGMTQLHATIGTWFSWQSRYVTTVFQGLYIHRSLAEWLQ